MDRFEAMSMLLEVVEQGSLSAASRNLSVPVTTLSRKLSELEAVLGTRLLVRTTRRITLTDAGINYITAARRILELVDEAEHEAAGEFTTPKGDLALAAPVMFGRLHVLPIVADFLALYPEINVRLLLADRNVHLVDDHIDMAVRIGRLPDSSMGATRVGSMRTVVCASPSLLASHGTPQAPDDLIRLPCVTVDIPVPPLAWRFRNNGSDASIEVPVRPRLSVTSTEAAADAVIRGVGAARLLLYQAAEAERSGKLKIILSTFEPEPTPVHLVHVERTQMPMKLRSFIDFAGPRLRAALEELTVRHSPGDRATGVLAQKPRSLFRTEIS
jgi:DNA-binding transcriptional LysR family regulator